MRSALMEALNEEVQAGNIKLNFFVLNRLFLAVAPGTPAPQNFQIPNNLDYLLCYINGAVFQPAGTIIPAPDIDINLTDNSTGWLFSDQVVNWVQIVGTAQEPFILPEPKLIPSNTSININLTNNTAAVTFARVNLAFVGLQVYYLRNFSREDLPYWG